MSKILVFFMALTLILVSTHTTQAATFSVCTLAELTTAITTANSNAQADTINFNCTPPSPLTFPSQFTIADDGFGNGITINANGNTVIFDGGGTTRFFAVSLDASLELNGLTLQNGNSSVSGAIENIGTLTIHNSIFDNNTSVSNSGAINNAPPSTLTITNSIFRNHSSRFGGVIFNDGILSITDSNFYNNSAIINGGVINNDGTATITNSTFTNNLSPDAGAIYNSFTVLTITNSTFTGNTGNALVNFATLDLINSTFSDNTVDAFENRGTGTTITRDSHYANNSCNSTNVGTVTDNGGNTVTNATGCPGSAPVTLSVSAVACNGDNAEFTINTGDTNFDITGAGADLDLLNSPAGLITLTGPSTWTNIIVTERRGEREFVPLGGISCPEGVIIPPPPPTVATATVLGCELDTTDGLDIANAPDNTYCRVLMRNGGVVSYSGAIPAELISLGVILAVDVYRLEGGMSVNTFPNYARVCLAGAGRLFYMDSRNAPRVSIELATEAEGNLTCGWIPAPGTLILTN